MNKNTFLGIAIGLAFIIASAGCGKSDSDTGSSDGGGSQFSGMDKEARDAVVAEVNQHWIKKPDGWIMAKTTGSPFAPDHYLVQVRELAVVDIESSPLNESDKMNGFEYAGIAHFKKIPYREAGDPGPIMDGMAHGFPMRERGRWSQWFDYSPESVRVDKLKGKWRVNPDTWMLRGNRPTAGDFEKAGVK